MSLLKKTWRFLGACAAFALAPVAAAQDFLPLAEPMEFNPDWQWFAPIDVDELSQNSLRNRGNMGWFINHDRTRLWVSRPNRGAHTDYTGDFFWGHRTDLGFVREDGTGWLVNFRKTSMTGWNGTLTERINRFEANDDPNSNTQVPLFPLADRNDPWSLARTYNVQDSINVGRFTNFELNRTWRRSPYRYGGILEPLIGVKFATFSDLTQDQNYSRSTNSIVTPGTVFTDAQVEQLESFETRNMNRLMGGQIGARYFTNYHRWRIGAEFRTFLGANFRTVTTDENTYRTEYDGVGTGSAVVYNDNRNVHNYTTSQKTAWGFEARLDAAYQVTKYIGLRGGVEVIDLARGVRRGGINVLRTSTAKDQNVVMAGINFGIELNR